MPRPRIYVNRHGRSVKTATGVQFNKGRTSYYIILEGEKRPEFKTWDEARAAYLSAQADKELKYLSPVPVPRRDARFGTPRVRLADLPPPELPDPSALGNDEVGKPSVTRVYEFIDESVPTESLRARLTADPKALAKKAGIPALRMSHRQLKVGWQLGDSYLSTTTLEKLKSKGVVGR